MPSAVIKVQAYEASSQILTLTFISGRVYTYLGVPADLAEGLKLAFAKGEYFNSVIRDRFPPRAVEVGTETAGQPLF